MAEVAELLLPPIDSEDDDEIGDGDDNAPPPCRARPSAPAHRQIHRHHSRRRLHYRHFDPGFFVPVFSPPRASSSCSFLRIGRGTPPGSVSGSDSDDPADRAVLALDPFDRSMPRCRSGMEVDPFRDGLGPLRFGAFDGVVGMGSDYHELGRGLGLGFGLEMPREEEGGFAGVDLEEEGLDWGGEGLFVDPRSLALGSSGGNGEGISGIVGFRSDSESDVEGERDVVRTLRPDDLDVPDAMDDLGLPFCWDCLRIEEESRDPDEDFDWEELDGRVDEREVLSVATGAGEDRSVIQGEADADLEIQGEDEEEEPGRNVEWEVLESNAAVEHEGAESYLGEDHEGFVYTSEFEILVGQFADHESSIKGNPPAAKLVVERLPSVVLTQADAGDSNTMCAVCKDEILMQEKAKQLPCSHHYHTDCILQWLRIRNTCPVCRYELPTDDPHYENWRAERANGGGVVHESLVNHNFEILGEE